MNVAIRIENAYTYSFVFVVCACGTPSARPAMIARFQNTGEIAGTVKWS